LAGLEGQLRLETSPAILFPDPPVIRFRPDGHTCACGAVLRVEKTRHRQVWTLSGPLVVHETVGHCPDCDRQALSGELSRLVPPHCRVGYDVLVFVGRALFQRYRSADEVVDELAARNVRLSPREIGYLGRKFILYLAAAHARAVPRIRQAMRLRGGYVLHLDAMHEEHSAALLTGLDSLSDIVLANVKLPSENADDISPFLQQIGTRFGTPAACVNDMGVGVCKAVAAVLPGTPDFICHFHFLRDAGKDLLGSSYDRLRQRLRHHSLTGRLCALVRQLRQRLVDRDPGSLADAIRLGKASTAAEHLPAASAYALAQWTLDGRNAGDGYGFPFDRPLLGFADRLQHLQQLLPRVKDVFLRDRWRDNAPFYDLDILAQKAATDPQLRAAVKELRWRAALFDDLRAAMRVAPPAGTEGLNSGMAPVSMASIRTGVLRFRRRLDTDPKLAADTLCRKLATQIDTYAERLFADPIVVSTPTGPVLIQSQRTNNVLEQLFRGLRRNHRRTTGNHSMNRRLQTMLADTPLVRNLDNPDYMNILLDGRPTVEQVFADIGLAELRTRMGQQHGTDRILPGFTALARMPTLPELVARLFTPLDQTPESNRVLRQ
jgi:hypothetical protein